MSYAEFNRLHRKEFPREILQVKCSNQFLPVRRIFRMERHLSEKMTQEMLFFAASVDIPEYASDDWEVTTEDNLWVPTLNAFVASWSGLSPKRFLIFEFVQSSLAFVDFDFALHSVPNQFQLDLQCRPLIRSASHWKQALSKQISFRIKLAQLSLFNLQMRLNLFWLSIYFGKGLDLAPDVWYACMTKLLIPEELCIRFLLPWIRNRDWRVNPTSGGLWLIRWNAHHQGFICYRGPNYANHYEGDDESNSLEVNLMWLDTRFVISDHSFVQTLGWDSFTTRSAGPLEVLGEIMTQLNKI